jgi:predicted ArsR family transcriptional regulator
VAELSRILDEDGYLAEWQAAADGSFLIVEHNCAILAVAQGHPDACRSEIEFLQTVLPDADVDRISHIVAGAHQCGYQVTPHVT